LFHKGVEEAVEVFRPEPPVTECSLDGGTDCSSHVVAMRSRPVDSEVELHCLNDLVNEFSEKLIVVGVVGVVARAS
jgi:hypothetical protein